MYDSTMRSEIRGLKACIHSGDGENCYLQIYRADDGIHILNIDMIEESIYHWVIDGDRATLKLESIFANPDQTGVEP